MPELLDAVEALAEASQRLVEVAVGLGEGGEVLEEGGLLALRQRSSGCSSSEATHPPCQRNLLRTTARLRI